QIYEDHAPLMRFLSELHAPMPQVLHMTAEFVVNSSLRTAFEGPDLDLERIRTLLDVATRERLGLEGPGLSYVLKRTLQKMMKSSSEDPGKFRRLEKFEPRITPLATFPLEVQLWAGKNPYWGVVEGLRPRFPGRGGGEGCAWA